MNNNFDKHIIKIAIATLKMSDTGVLIMGGMTKKEAIDHLIRLGKKIKLEK